MIKSILKAAIALATVTGAAVQANEFHAVNAALAQVLVNSGADLGAGKGRSFNLFRDVAHQGAWACDLYINLPENFSEMPTVSMHSEELGNDQEHNTIYANFESAHVTLTASALVVSAHQGGGTGYGTIPMPGDDYALIINLDGNGRAVSASLKEKVGFGSKAASCSFTGFYQSY